LKITNETKVGILAAVAIAILIVGYSFLKGNDVFSSDREFYAKYDNVEGLTISNPVLVNGYQIGRVSDLQLLPNGQILASLNIDPEYDIPNNTVARLESTNLLGSKGIVFELGTSKKYASDGDTLKSNVEKDLMQQVQPIQKKAEAIVARLDSVLSSVNATINPQFQKNVNRSFASIANSLETLEGTTRKFDHIVGSESNRLSAIFANLESISNNFKENNQRISSIMSNIDKITDDFSKANFSQTVENANKAVAEFQAAINKVNNGQGSLGQLINDEKLYNNLSNAAENLDKLMIDLKANPKRYVHFSVFGGKKD
jgi:phospholipid/cholesterol/gamma-HCH transport system substrate-binding protein